MSLRAFLHIPQRTAKILVYSTLGIVVLFLALTRTKVGRDGLRQQIELQFNETFVGNIQIEQLQGNLLNTLYAENIQFFDRSGVRVAYIEGAILEPSWIELMRRTISMDRVTLIKPEVNMTQQADSSWNIGDVFRRKDGKPPQLFFNSSDIRIIDGTVFSQPIENTVKPGNPFARFSHPAVHQIQARLNVEVRAGSHLVDIEQSAFEMPDASIAVQDFHGQMFVGKGRIELNELYIESDATRLNLSASIDHIDSLATAPEASFIDLELRDSVIDQDALTRLFPDLALADTIFLAATMKGTVNNLLISSIQLAHGNLIVDAAGTVRGLPDSLMFTFDLANSSFSRDDLNRIAPRLDLGTMAPRDPLFFETLYGKGAFVLDGRPLENSLFGEVNFDFSSAGGSLNGNLEVSQNRTESHTYIYSILEADRIDVASFLPGLNLSTTLNGRALIEGAGRSFNELAADVQLNLGSSIIQGRPLDSLETYIYADTRAIDLEGSVRHSAYGQLVTEASMRLDQPDRPVQANLRLNALDVSGILDTDTLSTHLDGSVRLDLRGTTRSSLRGSVNINLDSSSVAHGDLVKPLPAHSTTISLVDLENGLQEFAIDGDVARITLQGNLTSDALFPMGAFWKESLWQTISELIDKGAPILDASGAFVAVQDSAIYETVNSLYLDQLAQSLQTALERSGHPLPSELDIAFAMRNASLIHPWFALLPDFSTNLSGSFQIASDMDDFDFQGQMQADSLVSGQFKMERLRGRFSLHANQLEPVEDRITLDTRVQADSIHFIGQVFPQATFDLTLDNHLGTMNILTKSTRRVGPQRLITSFELLPEKNTFNVDELLLSVGNSFWTIAEPTYVEVYGRRLVIPGLTVQSKSAESNILQSIKLSGVLSPSPRDTASIVIDNIAIRPISQFLNMEVPLGGLFNGQLAFTTTNKQPELTGVIDIDRFSFDQRVVGNVMLSSRYIPGEPDVGLHIEVSPVEQFNQDEFLPDAALAATYEENDLIIDGTFRLPRFNQAATGFIDAGAINLDVDMRRVDVFFFEYIFATLLERTDGYLTGAGNITGDFSYPIFDLDLNIVDGELYIPKFNLNYTDFEGPIRIDQEGIKLQDATFTDPTGGEATISGGFLFNEYRFFSFDLEARLNEILIMNQDNAGDLPFYGQIWGSGTLQLTGPTDNAFLFSQDAITKASSELFIPVSEEEFAYDEGFIIFADSAGNIPDFSRLNYRKNLLSKRPEGERKFIDGMDMDLNITVPTGSTIHLVFDPLLGDVINAVSSGRVQLQKREGEFSTFGTLSVESGDYLFTAGDVFARRFLIDRGGTITWDGNPINARMNIPASYRTRVSTAGLPGNPFNENTLIPLIVRLNISGRVAVPLVELKLEADRSDRNYQGNYEGLEAFLNQSERTTDFATSVLLTNSFLLTTEASPNSGTLTNSGEQIAFSSVSQLVSSQLNRFLNEAIPNADFNLGLQGESLEDPDVTYGVALYLLDQRLVIRGQGVYQRELTPNQSGLEGEFEVEVRLSPSISVSVFIRQEGDILADNALTRARGAGLSYQTQFSTWDRFFNRLFGWIGKKNKPSESDESVAEGTTNKE